MALSTSVFAPTVRMVQPAFIYSTGEARVYFSFSSFNTIDDIVGLRYSIIDPNKKSAYGNNSMIIIDENNKEDKIFVNKDGIKSGDSTIEYYFTISFIIDWAKFDELILNQYYQVQIELQDKDGNWSAPSQATLIRPISSCIFTIDGLNSETINNVESNDLKEIKGRIKYTDGSTKEYLAKYCIDIYDTNSTPNLLYTTNWTGNVNGLSFISKIKYNFMEEQSYTLKFKGATVNGYLIEEEYNIKINGYRSVPEWEDFQIIEDINGNQEFYSDINSGSIYIKFRATPFIGSIIVQRASSETEFKAWENILKINLEAEDALKEGIAIYDYLVDGSFHMYQYRFLKVTEDGVVAITKDTYQIESTYEDIFLSNIDKQLAIKYNPNISGFKWVVQESVTNALGGRFPLIRRNGETKYRQFTLSGTLYFDPLMFSTATFESRLLPMSNFFSNDNSVLFLNLNEVDNPLWAAAAWSNRSMESKLAFYEQKFKEMAMEFLADGKPKLFRSPTEGMMLVMLTNISFTPNKQLGRRIADFSATVTEFAEANLENFIKYGIAPDIANTYYAIEATGITKSDLEVTPYISESQLFSQVNASSQTANGETFLKVTQRTVRL